MDIIVLIFSPGFMVFVRLVSVRTNDGFPAQRQQLKIERSAVDTESDRVHGSSVSAGDPANWHFPSYIPTIRADEDHAWIFSGLHFFSSSQERREGVGSRRINLYPSLSVWVPTLSPHAVSWVGPGD
jgi:hypothetical protein